MTNDIKRKKLIITMNDSGDVGKSTFINGMKCKLDKYGITTDLYDGDKNNQTTYGRYSKKDSKGVALPDDKQTPRDGCVRFDLQTSPEFIINTFQKDAEVILIDLPARALAQAQTSLGDKETFWQVIGYNNIEPNLVVPIVTEKDFHSLDVLNQDIQLSDLDYPIRVILLSNKGYQKFKGNFTTMNQLYNSNATIQAMRDDPKIELIETESQVMYDKPGSVVNALQGKSLQQVIDNPAKVPVIDFLVQALNADTERIYQAIMN